MCEKFFLQKCVRAQTKDPTQKLVYKDKKVSSRTRFSTHSEEQKSKNGHDLARTQAEESFSPYLVP